MTYAEDLIPQTDPNPRTAGPLYAQNIDAVLLALLKGRTPVSVTEHGATGGGVDDGHDTSAFIDAFDHAQAIEGFVIVPPPPSGRYYSVGQITRDHDGVALVGVDPYRSWVKTHAINECVLQAGSDIDTTNRRFGFLVANMRLSQVPNHTDDGFGALRSFAVTGVWIVNNFFDGCENAVALMHGARNDTDPNMSLLNDRRTLYGYVSFNRFDSTRNMGIQLFHTLHCRATHNTMFTDSVTNIGPGVRVNASEDAIVTDNMINGHQRGISLQGSDYLVTNATSSQAPYCLRPYIARNTLLNIGTDAIQAYNDIREPVIESNYIKTWGTESAFGQKAIDLRTDAVGSWSKAKVRHNLIDATGTSALDLAIVADSGSDLSIKGNEVYNEPTDQNAVSITNCGGLKIVKDNLLAAASGATGALLCSIRETGSLAGSVTVATGNVFVADQPAAANKLAGSGSGTFITQTNDSRDANVYVSGTGTRRITRNTGEQASVADGGTITHGLSSAPTKAFVQTTVAGEFASVTAKGSTTITVAIKKHDGTAGTTQSIEWFAEV